MNQTQIKLQVSSLVKLPEPVRLELAKDCRPHSGVACKIALTNEMNQTLYGLAIPHSVQPIMFDSPINVSVTMMFIEDQRAMPESNRVVAIQKSQDHILHLVAEKYKEFLIDSLTSLEIDTKYSQN